MKVCPTNEISDYTGGYVVVVSPDCCILFWTVVIDHVLSCYYTVIELLILLGLI